MAKILVTGFDPFGGEPVNPAFEAVKKLPATIAGADVVTLKIPTVFTRSAEVLEQAIEREQPDWVLCVGQAGGRSAMTVEKVAINLAEARIPDNDGEQPLDQPLREDGETAYFATIPVKDMVAAMNEAGIPAFVSYTAGTYVCNSIMYNLLYLCSKRFHGVKGGFVHVPYATEQGVGKPNGTPTMPLETITRALACGIEAIVTNEHDVAAVAGETH